jgi:MFS family permease
MTSDSIGAAARGGTEAARGGIGHWLALTAMISGGTCIGLLFTALPPVLHRMGEHFAGGGHGELQAQLIMSSAGFGLLLGGLAAALLIERLGARRLLLGGLVLYALAGSAGLYLDDVTALYLSRILAGMAAANISTAANSFIGTYFDEAGRGRMLSAVAALGSVISVVAVLAAGYMGEHVGWRGAFALYLVFPAVLLLAALGSSLGPGLVPARGRAAPGGLIGLMWPVYLMIAALYVVLMMTSTQLSFLLTENGITSPVVQSRVISMSFAFLFVGAVLYGWLQGRIGATGSFRVGLLLLGVGIGALGFARDPWSAALFTAVKGIGAGFLNPGFIHLVLNRAPEALRGRALGLMTSSMFLGDLMNPVIVAPIRMWLGIHEAFIAFGVAVLVGAAVSVAAGRRRAAA